MMMVPGFRLVSQLDLGQQWEYATECCGWSSAWKTSEHAAWQSAKRRVRTERDAALNALQMAEGGDD